jgi:two-component system response regulator VicR
MNSGIWCPNIMGKHILVINDVKEILQLYEAILHEEGGCDVTTATFKPKMIESIRELKPDLIIMDYIFGGEALGWNLMEMLKTDPTTSNIPLVICTGAIQGLRKREGFLADESIGVLYKPFHVEELLNVVKRTLGQVE